MNTKNIMQAAFLGLSYKDNEIDYSLLFNNKIKGSVKFNKKNYHKELLDFVKKIAKENKVKIYSAGFINFPDFEKIATKFWLKLDVVPVLINKSNGSFEDRVKLASLEARAIFNKDLSPNHTFNKYNLVKERFLSDLSSYKKIAKPKDWEKIIKIAKEIKEKNIKILFINSTAAGGGVSLMRHALIRLSSLLKIDLKWHVLKGSTEIFNITKKKIHNVLHGIAKPDVFLTDLDKAKYNKWIKECFKNIKDLLKDINVVVVDDPQPSGLIPLIKKEYPGIKVLYRSHIQIYSKLINNNVKQNKNTWNFVWNNAKEADLFIAHPVKEFVPKDVDRKKVLYFPATTDRLDGLNKNITHENKKYYFQLFNSILEKSGFKYLNLKRPYIIQVARFDPSKGILDVVESYWKLRKIMIEKGVKLKNIPQLVIAGNGATDDPESVPIYQELIQHINTDSFKHIKDDIKVACLPHNDQLLNVLLGGAKIALQLSHREGFEIKVTEALMKGVPVIAYKTGGIPLQILDGKTGYLIQKGKTKEVAEKILLLLDDKKLYKKLSLNAKKNINDDFLTINSLYRWLSLSL